MKFDFIMTGQQLIECDTTIDSAGNKVVPINDYAVSLVPFKAVLCTKNAAAMALGKLGGEKGGKARADKLTAERRREIASKAAKTRWNKT